MECNFPYQTLKFYNTYNTWAGNFYLNFYWKESIEKLYTHKALCEIKEEVQENERRREEEEKRKAAEIDQKREERKKIVLEMARKKLKEKEEKEEKEDLLESDLKYSCTFRNYSSHLRVVLQMKKHLIKNGIKY